MKRGTKPAKHYKDKLDEVTKERNLYRGQLGRRETDFENRTLAVHSSTVVKLQGELDSLTSAGRMYKTNAKKAADEADRARHELAAERIAHQGALLEAASAAKTSLDEAEAAAAKKFNIAIARKNYMISTRDEKLADAQSACIEIQEALDTQVELGSERLATIRQICGRLGAAGRESCAAKTRSTSLRTRP